MTREELTSKWTYLEVLHAESKATAILKEIRIAIEQLRTWNPTLLDSPGGRRLARLSCRSEDVLRSLDAIGRVVERAPIEEGEKMSRDLESAREHVWAEWLVLREALGWIFAARRVHRTVSTYATRHLDHFRQNAPSLEQTTTIGLDAVRMQRRADELGDALWLATIQMDALSIDGLHSLQERLNALQSSALDSVDVFNARVRAGAGFWKKLRWWARRLLRR